MDIKSTFGAESMSSWGLLTSPGTGFYIPAYQREYSWDKDNVNRLFEDLVHGVHMLLRAESNKKDTVTFIGALIVIHDTNYQTVKPYIVGELPSRVLLVIDGQQRLSTILIVNTLIHEQLTVRLNQLKRIGDKTHPGIRWITDKMEVARQEIRMTFEQDMITGSESYRWYPRIIRAFDDTWAKDADMAKYESPIAAYLNGYMNFSRFDPDSEYVHSAPLDSDESKHRQVIQNYQLAREAIKQIVNESDELCLPALSDIVVDESLQMSLLDQPISPETLAIIGSSDRAATLCSEILRLLILGKYLNRRVAITLVTAKNEDYAFDIFEALNTTGTPLTAFETFRPRVINAETLPKFGNSPSRAYLQKIEGFLEQYISADAKQKATDRLLIPFALAETGYKLSKRLREQRAYLRLRYEELHSLDERRTFVQHMAHSSTFVKSYWPETAEEQSEIRNLPFTSPELVALCVEMLRASRHEIAIGPLTRFFAQLSEPVAHDQALTELETACKAMAAFWVFWRSVRRTTGGIDSRYRELMEKGVSELSIQPFARRKSLSQGYTHNPVPSAGNLKAALRHYLEKSKSSSISSKKDWIQQSRELPFYGNVPNPIIRFILLASIHDTYYDKSVPGLHVAAKKGSLPMLTLEQWKGNFTVEHIAPQNDSANQWNSDLYEDPDLVHQIGNLTLLPPYENNLVGNQSWYHKRLIYSVLSAPTQGELDDQLAKAKAEGIQVKGSLKTSLADSRYLPHVKAVAALTGDWNRDMVRKRTERILDLAWDRLAPWLDLQT